MRMSCKPTPSLEAVRRTEPQSVRLRVSHRLPGLNIKEDIKIMNFLAYSPWGDLRNREMSLERLSYNG